MPAQFKTTKERLKNLEVSPSKSRGQNFLIAPGAIDKIIEFGRPEAHEELLEIGPGLGALTGELLRVAPLTVIEIEERFCDELEQKYDNLTIVNEDVRFVDMAELGSNLTVFGNLPYSFSTDILFHLVENSASISRAILMLQKEFVQRLVGQPGTKAYGKLSIACQLRARMKAGPIITGDCFHPQANVDSQVVEMSFYEEPLHHVESFFWLQRVVAAAFFRRRKKILNSIAASASFPGVDFAALCAAVGIDTNLRAEDIPIDGFAALSNEYVRVHESSPE